MACLSSYLTDSGAACLAMINQYCGTPLNLHNLRNLATDAFLKGLAEAGQTLGYEALLVKVNLTKLDPCDNLCITHCQVIDYIPVWRVKGDRILISNPAIGKAWLLHPEFEAILRSLSTVSLLSKALVTNS